MQLVTTYIGTQMIDNNHIKIATSKQMLGKAYVNENNEFLTARGYNKLKKDNVLKHFTTQVSKAKIFNVFVNDLWPLTNTQVLDTEFVTLYILQYRTEEHTRPWLNEIVKVNNEPDRYQILSIDLDEHELNVYKLLVKKL